jgi:hypothetical protein
MYLDNGLFTVPSFAVYCNMHTLLNVIDFIRSQSCDNTSQTLVQSQYLLGDRHPDCVVLVGGLVFRLCYTQIPNSAHVTTFTSAVIVWTLA